MSPKKDRHTSPPVVIVRKKVAKGRGTSTPAQPAPHRSAPVKAKVPVAPSTQPVAQPLPSPVQAQPSRSSPSPDAPGVTATGASKKEQEKQARRELLEVLRDRWPLTFPQDSQRVKPLAIGIKGDIAGYLPEHSLLRISAAIGLFQRLVGPAYFRAILKGGPRYDLDGNPRGEVTADEQEQAQKGLTAYFERRKQRMREKKAPESVEPAETEGKHHG